MADVGSLGGVSYDIIAEDKTSAALDSARESWVITAGDIIDQIDKIDQRVQEFAEISAVSAGSAERVAILTGLSADSLEKLAVKYTDVTTPMTEVYEIQELLARNHITTLEQMDQLIPRIDAFGDANQTNADTLMTNVIPALNNFGINISDTNKYMDQLTYLFQQTNLSSSTWAGEMRRTAPVLSDMNVSFDDTNALLLTAYDRYGDGRKALQLLTAAAAEAEKQNLTGADAVAFMTEKMGLNTQAFNDNKEEISGHVGITNDLAGAEDKMHTSMEKITVEAESQIPLFGGLFDVLSPLTGVLASVGEAGMGLLIFDKVLMGGALTAKFAFITEWLAGFASGAAGELSTIGASIGGSLVAGIGIGIAAGLAGVWVLLKTGVLDKLSTLGREIETSGAGYAIMNALKVILAPIGSLGAAIIDIVKGDFKNIPRDMAEPFKQAGDVIKKAMGDIPTIVRGVLDKAGEAGRNFGDTLRTSLGGMNFSSVVASVQSMFSGIGSAFRGMAGQVQGVFQQLVNAILGIFNSIKTGMYSAGMNMITSFVNGIIAAAGGIINAIKGVLDKIKAMLSFRSPAKEGPLSEEIAWDRYLTGGMDKAAPKIAMAAASNLAAPVAAGVASPGAAAGAGAPAGGGGGGGSVTIAAGAIVIQGVGKNAEEIADVVLKRIAEKMADQRKARGYA